MQWLYFLLRFLILRAMRCQPDRQSRPSFARSFPSFSLFSRPAGYYPSLRRLCLTRVFFWRDRSFCQVLAAYKIFARIVFAYLHITRCMIKGLYVGCMSVKMILESDILLYVLYERLYIKIVNSILDEYHRNLTINISVKRRLYMYV